MHHFGATTILIAVPLALACFACGSGRCAPTPIEARPAQLKTTPAASTTAPTPEEADDDSCGGDTFGLAAGGEKVAEAMIARKRGTMARAQKQIVATSHRLATDAGLAVLRTGGNAADAFVAATLVQDVVLPGVTSTAGLTGIIVYEAKTKSLTYIHGGLADPIDPAARYRRGDAAIGRQVLVPGAPAAYATLARRFGTKRLRDLVEPAARLAVDGFTVDRLYAGTVASRRDVLMRSAYGRATFFHGDKPVAEGERLNLAELGRSLRAFGDDPSFFYRSTWPRAAVALVKANGGALVLSDFDTYAPEIGTPSHGRFMGHDIYGSGHGGVKLVVTLQALERLRVRKGAGAGAAAVVEAPSSSADELERLLRVHSVTNALPFLHDRAFLARGAGTAPQIAEATDAVVKYVEDAAAPSPPAERAGTHSSAVVVVDGQGNVVVATHTIQTLPWGEGLFVGGVPLSTSAPVAFDDAIAATSHLRIDSLTNTIVMKDGGVRAALAVYGTGLHPADAQILDAVIARGLNAEEAVLAPRVGYFRFDAKKMTLDYDWRSVDPRLSPKLLCTMKRRGFHLERSIEGYPAGIVDTGFPTLVTMGPNGIEGMTPELIEGSRPEIERDSTSSGRVLIAYVTARRSTVFVRARSSAKPAVLVGTARPHGDDERPSTKTGQMIGTSAFMPPEQALSRARDVDARTDIWSAGAPLSRCFPVSTCTSPRRAPSIS